MSRHETAPAVLVARALRKTFPGGVVANDRVDLELRAGEVHALLGENGAGKSTLSSCLTGHYTPDSGELLLDGRPVSFASPGAALAAGIFMVHQHFRLVESFTVAENIELGFDRPYDPAEAVSRARDLGERYGLGVDPAAHVWQLSVGQQQRVEILKALAREARVLILDEPTAVLAGAEIDALLGVVRQIAAEGRTVVFISHKLDEVLAVADRVTVLRDGSSVGTHSIDGADARSLARLMVGRDVDLTAQRMARQHPPSVGAAVVLRVHDVSARGDRGEVAVDRVSFEVRAGEVLGLCGVAGNGQRELAEAIAGMRAWSDGEITVGGHTQRRPDPRAAMKAGLAYVPEDRFGTALAPSLPVEDNLALTAFRDRPLSLGPFVRRQRIRDRARRLIERYRVRTPGPTTPARLLSGGNAQKVVVARVLTSEPRVVVASSPTRGLDVGATHAVRTLIAEAADAGVGVVLISEDLQEILSLSDRIGVMFRGRLVGMRDRGEADVEDLGMLMGGAALEGLQMELPLRDQLSSGAVSGGRASSTERGQ